MPRSDTFLAARHCAPLLVALVPFGFVYGAVAVDGGLSVSQTLGFSLATYAGASQFLAIQMIGLGSPLWAILLAVLAVNARHLLYSASIGRHLAGFTRAEKALAFFLLVDPAFAAGEARAATGRLTPRYYFTFGCMLYVGWALATLAGALAGGYIEDPRRWGLDFALPVYFLAQTMAFRRRSQFATTLLVGAGTALLVYATLGSPWHVTLAGVAGMAAAAIRTPPEARA